MANSLPPGGERVGGGTVHGPEFTNALPYPPCAGGEFIESGVGRLAGDGDVMTWLFAEPCVVIRTKAGALLQPLDRGRSGMTIAAFNRRHLVNSAQRTLGGKLALMLYGTNFNCLRSCWKYRSASHAPWRRPKPSRDSLEAGLKRTASPALIGKASSDPHDG